MNEKQNISLKESKTLMFCLAATIILIPLNAYIWTAPLVISFVLMLIKIKKSETKLEFGNIEMYRSDISYNFRNFDNKLERHNFFDYKLDAFTVYVCDFVCKHIKFFKKYRKSEKTYIFAVFRCGNCAGIRIYTICKRARHGT